MRHPNAIIAGVHKSGTTSLFNWLSDHPDVCGASKKETCFLLDNANKYNQEANIHDHGIKKYASFFTHCQEEKVYLEATPGYMLHETPLKVLPKIKPVPKIIFLLRKPADKIHSRFRYNKYTRGVIHTDVTFEEYLQKKAGQKIIERTKYHKYLKKWLNSFERNQIKVLLFETFTFSPKKVLREVSEFLGIDKKFWDNYAFEQRNKSVQIKNKRLHKFIVRITRFTPTFIKKNLKYAYFKFNTSAPPPVCGREKQVKESLEKEFAYCYDWLADNFDLDLSQWNND